MVVDGHRPPAEALASALKLHGHRVLAAAAPPAGAAELVISRTPEVCLPGTATPAEPGVFDPVVRIERERPQIAVVALGPVLSPRDQCSWVWWHSSAERGRRRFVPGRRSRLAEHRSDEAVDRSRGGFTTKIHLTSTEAVARWPF